MEETYHSNTETRLTDRPAPLHIYFERVTVLMVNNISQTGMNLRYFGFMNEKGNDEKLTK